jgi:hypothetical protein
MLEDDDLPGGEEDTTEDIAEDTTEEDTGTEDTTEEPVALETPKPAKRGAADTIRELRARAQRAEADAAAERALRSHTPAPTVDHAAIAAEERRRLEEMSDVDRAMYVQNRSNNQTQIALQQLRLEMQIENDKRLLRDEITANPEFSRYEDIVEREFNACIQKGQPRSRIELLNQAIGNEIRTKRGSAIGKAKRAADKTTQRETTKPVSARSGVSGSPGKAAESPGEILRRRLEGREYQPY